VKDGQGRGSYPSRRGIRPCRECRSMRVGCGQAGALATPSCSCSAGTSPNPGGWASDDQPNAPLRCGNAALRDHRQTQFNAASSGERCYLLTRRKDRRGRTALRWGGAWRPRVGRPHRHERPGGAGPRHGGTGQPCPAQAAGEAARRGGISAGQLSCGHVSGFRRCPRPSSCPAPARDRPASAGCLHAR